MMMAQVARIKKVPVLNIMWLVLSHVLLLLVELHVHYQELLVAILHVLVEAPFLKVNAQA